MNKVLGFWACSLWAALFLLGFAPSSATAQCSGLTVTVQNTTNIACAGDNNGTINLNVQIDSASCSSPTVVLNEVMYRPRLSNGLNPNAGEQIELIAPAGTNIGCYTLTDGDWAVTIPPNTIVGSDGIFTIGNDAVHGAGTFDLDAENCGCFVEGTGGGGLMILTDGGEYVALFNQTGAFIDGLVYSDASTTAGNRPPNGDLATAGGVMTLASLTGCPATVTIPAQASFPAFMLPNLARDSSFVRLPDGTGNAWGIQTNGSINTCNAGTLNSYSLLWSNGATTANLSGLAAGVYTVTATHSSGCTLTQSATITEPAALNISLDSTRVAGCAVATGAAFVSPSGGTVPYTYLWSNASTAQDLQNVSAGTYRLTVTDVRGCQNSISATIAGTSGLAASASVTQPNCAGGSNGSISLQITGGAPFPAFVWSNGRTTQNLTGLVAGAYSVTIVETNGCLTTLQTQVTQPSPLSVSIPSQQQISCAGANDGSLTAQASGGTAAYSFLWQPSGATSASIGALAPNTYQLTATDANGCTASSSATITEPAALTLSLNILVDQLDCDLLPIGHIVPNAQGGTAPVEFLWNDGNTENERNDLGAGTASITATDANGCTASAFALISAPFVPTISAIFDTTNTNFTAVLTATPMRIRATNTPQTEVGYLWTIISGNAANITFNQTNQPDAILTAQVSGTYTILVTATSIDGCTLTDTLTMEVYDNFLGIPDAFSPNGDGDNDLFRPIGLNAQYIKAFRIYNRWGQLVYDDNTLSSGGWDGSIGGSQQARDTYIYQIIYQLPREEEKQLQGSFLLMR